MVQHSGSGLLRRAARELSMTRASRSLLTSDASHDHDQQHDAVVASSDLATHPNVGLAHLFVPLSRSCHPDCTNRGNCNAEEGRCECPFGYTGPACEEALLPGCQLGPDLEPFFGVLIPRSCECVRQANRFFGCTPDDDTCTLRSLGYHDIKCYSYPDKPASEQWSLMPDSTDSEAVFYTGPMWQEVVLKPLAPMAGLVGWDSWNSAYLSLPLERCGETKCHGRGACIMHVQDDDAESIRQAVQAGVARCLCYKGYMGHTCGDDMDVLCPGGCRERGRCIRGFCHCQPPYWGLDCGRSHAWQLAPGAEHVPNRQVLRIYVYELPANLAFPVPLDDNILDMNEPSYQTHRMFMALLLQDDNVRTENPLEANLFYIPANAYAYASNTNPPTNQILAAIKYVSDNYPYFNASKGRDHFIWTTGDRGSCYLPKSVSQVIHVTLFGLHSNLADNGTSFVHPLPSLHPSYGCYHPKKDVLAAPWYDHMVGSTEAPGLYDKLVAEHGQSPDRDLLFFFAGSIRADDNSYSGGVRQALSKHLKQLLASGGNFSDILFVEGYTRDYEELYLRSKFCLAPHGSGFGVRLTLAMTHGCVPVIIQDQVYQPYESDGILPYSQFSIRLAKSDIPHLVSVLRSVSSGRLCQMRLAMARYHKAFLWDPALGGRAYNYTIKALNQRLHGLWGQLWGHAADRRRRLHLRTA